VETFSEDVFEFREVRIVGGDNRLITINQLIQKYAIAIY
jgi:hypothetical protein